MSHRVTTHIIYLIAALIGLSSSSLSAADRGRSSGGDHSLLSEGRWIKISADTTSVHRVSFSQLREWGFTDPSEIIVAGYGSVERAHSLDTAPDDLPIIPIYRHDDAIYFYAEGDTRAELTSRPDVTGGTPFVTHRNLYSTGSYYFIGERSGYSSPDIDRQSLPTPETPEYVSTHYRLTNKLFEEYHPTLHGLLSTSRLIDESTPRSVSIPCDGHNGKGDLYYSYIWKLPFNITRNSSIAFSDDITAYNASTDRLKGVSSDAELLFSVRDNRHVALDMRDDATTFTATISNPGNSFTTLAITDYTFIYETPNNISSAKPATLYFAKLSSSVAINLYGIDDNTVVWDVTTPRTPTAMIPVKNIAEPEVTTVIPPESCRKLHIFNTGHTATIPAPQFVSTVEPQNLHSMRDADLLIVTTEATYGPALRLAEAHRVHQGLNVEVVKQSEVFNEYSSGALHPNGLRHLVKRMSDDSHPLRYVLLLGAASWDMRHIYDESGTEYLVMYSCESPEEMGKGSHAYNSDLYFGITDERIDRSLSSMLAKAKISTGRVPVYDTNAAERYVDKAIDYLSNPLKSGVFNHAIISGGVGDSNAHLEAAENIGNTISSLTVHPTLNRAHLSLFDIDIKLSFGSEPLMQYLDNRLSGKPRLYIYTGHSTIKMISHHSHNISNENDYNYGSLPVVFLASCSTTPIDIPELSLGVTMINHNPGPISVIGSGNDVFLNYNLSLAYSFASLFYSTTGGECLGDVFRNAVNSTATSSSVYQNSLCYNFLGDPALPRYLPDGKIKVTCIGGNDITSSDAAISVPALSPITISGHILGSDGNIDTSFSGQMYIDIYNTPYSRETYSYNNDKPRNLTIDEDMIHTSAVTVDKGIWSAELTLPEVAETGINRMTLYAVAADGARTASGGDKHLSIATADNSSSARVDSSPPSITITLDEGNGSTDITSSSPTLHIEITDNESGIGNNTAVIGGTTRVMIDGKSRPQISAAITPSAPGVSAGSYQLENLADGVHTVTVTARDVAGNTTTETRQFTVTHLNSEATLSTSDKIVRSDVTFTLSHSLPISTANQRLIIRNMDGATVFTAHSVAFPYTWNFVDMNGNTLPDGTYRASVVIEARPYYTSTPETTFTIVKK